MEEIYVECMICGMRISLKRGAIRGGAVLSEHFKIAHGLDLEEDFVDSIEEYADGDFAE